MTKQAKLILLIFLVGVFITFFMIRGCGEEIDIQAIISIESSGNPHAYNAKSGAIGLMQITEICLDEFNAFAFADNIYGLGDLYNPPVNIMIGTWYINERIPQMLKHYRIEDTVENRLISYNFGIGNLRKYLKGEVKLPKETRNYIKKYRRLINEN